MRVMFCTEKNILLYLLLIVFLFFTFRLEKKTPSEQKQLESQRSAVCLGDDMGQRRPSRYYAHEFRRYRKIKTGNSCENQRSKGIVCILDTNIHGGSKRNISDQGKVECIIQYCMATRR